MTDEDEDRKNNEPDIFLSVEKTADGYIEKDRNGGKHKYVRLSGSRRLTIESLSVRWIIEALSGAKRCVIYGSGREKIRTIGATGEFPIFFVEIVSGDRPGKATLAQSYLLGVRDELSIVISETAISALAEELGKAKTKRTISAQVREGIFFGSSAEAEGDVLLLPWLEEQRKTTTFYGDEIAVEFDLEIIDLTVGPEASFFGESEARVQADISGHVGVYYSRQEHPLKDTFEKMHAEISSMRSELKTALTVMAILVFLLLIRFW